MKDWTHEENTINKNLHSGATLSEIAKDYGISIGEMKTKLEKIVCDFHEKGETNDAIKKVLNLETEVIQYILDKRAMVSKEDISQNKKATLHDIGMLAELIYDRLGRDTVNVYIITRWRYSFVRDTCLMNPRELFPFPSRDM
jgi:hypothetical protein